MNFNTPILAFLQPAINRKISSASLFLYMQLGLRYGVPSEPVVITNEEIATFIPNQQIAVISRLLKRLEKAGLITMTHTAGQRGVLRTIQLLPVEEGGNDEN